MQQAPGLLGSIRVEGLLTPRRVDGYLPATPGSMAGGNTPLSQMPDLPITIPLPDGLDVDICQGEVSTSEKALGVWSMVDGNDEKHLEENVTWRVEKWISKMTNGHLPAKLG